MPRLDMRLPGIFRLLLRVGCGAALKSPHTNNDGRCVAHQVRSMGYRVVSTLLWSDHDLHCEVEGTIGLTPGRVPDHFFRPTVGAQDD